MATSRRVTKCGGEVPHRLRVRGQRSLHRRPGPGDDGRRKRASCDVGLQEYTAGSILGWSTGPSAAPATLSGIPRRQLGLSSSVKPVAQVLDFLDQGAVSLRRDEDRRRATVVHKHNVLIAYVASKLAQPGTGFADGNELAHRKTSFRSPMRVTVIAQAASSTM